jgi:hypothetical protein
LGERRLKARKIADTRSSTGLLDQRFMQFDDLAE